MANKFIISVDNCADYMKSFMDANGMYYIPLKRVLGDKEFAEIYDSEAEFEAPYNDLKKGLRPTTSQINPDEFVAYFNKILAKEPAGDIIHVSLSSALSGTHNSAVNASEQINKTLNGRKIYAFDSLTVACGIQMLVDKLLELRSTTSADKAIEAITKIRDNTQLFFLVDDLFNLKRGGRLSATKAILGAILGVRPILTVNSKGNVKVESTVRGLGKAMEYLLAQIEKHHGKTDKFYITRSTKSDTYTKFREMLCAKYPNAVVKESLVGPIIGTHVGSGTVGIFFEGDPRLNID